MYADNIKSGKDEIAWGKRQWTARTNSREWVSKDRRNWLRQEASRESQRCQGSEYQEESSELHSRVASNSSRILQLSVYRHIVDGSPSWLAVGGCGHAFSSGLKGYKQTECVLILGIVYNWLYEVHQRSPSTRITSSVQIRGCYEGPSSWWVSWTRPPITLNGPTEWARKRPFVMVSLRDWSCFYFSII